MKRIARFSETWFKRSLWLVAFIFAFFLIGLGNAIIGDLPKVQDSLSLTDFVAQPAYDALEKNITELDKNQEALQQEKTALNLDLTSARNDLVQAENLLRDWQTTRGVTELNEQNPEVVKRTQALEELRSKIRQVQAQIEAKDKVLLTGQHELDALYEKKDTLEEAARKQLESAQNRQQLMVFLYRLMLTLPLLVVAGWLWKTKRKSTYWPFVWGFIFFALFAFFVELVPYLPSYGGYVRYSVGIIITLLVGRQIILALNRYLERQRQKEAEPEEARRSELDFDAALLKLSKNHCPSCERPVNLQNESIDFCPYCGIGLFHYCGNCHTRISTFSRFCFSCGTSTTDTPSVQKSVPVMQNPASSLKSDLK